MPNKNNVIKRRNAVLTAIVEYKREHDGCSPSVRDISDATGLALSMVNFYLRKLESQGVIALLDGARGIMTTNGAWKYGGSNTLKFSRHPDTGDPEESKVLTVVNTEIGAVSVSIVTNTGEMLADAVIEYRGDQIKLHVWNEHDVCLDPSIEPVVLVKDVPTAIKRAERRKG